MKNSAIRTVSASLIKAELETKTGHKVSVRSDSKRPSDWVFRFENTDVFVTWKHDPTRQVSVDPLFYTDINKLTKEIKKSIEDNKGLNKFWYITR